MKAVLQWLALAGLTLATAKFAAADRLVDYVAPSLLGDTNNVKPRVSATNITATATARRPVTSGDRWERFETEFGVKRRNDSPVLDSLQTAKYQLDRTTFAVQELMDTVEQSLSFDYGLHDLGMAVPEPRPYRRSDTINLMDAIQNARFKSDIDLKLASKSYVGVKLVLPLGD
jgi:hypothetical protein